MTGGRWQLPLGWQWKYLREIGLVYGGGTPVDAQDPANFEPEGYPWVTPADLSNYHSAYVAGGRRALSTRGLMSSGAVMLPPGSVLFSSRAPIGYCVIAANDIATSQGFKSLFLNPAMSPEYVREYLAGSVDYAESMARGTTFKELSGARFGELQIPVATSEEQRDIAKKLHRLNPLPQKATAEISAAAKAVRLLKTAVLRSAFSGALTQDWRSKNKTESSEDLIARLPQQPNSLSKRYTTDRIVEGGFALSMNGRQTDLPSGWSWQPLVQVARQETGHTPSRSIAAYWDGEIPWVGVTDAASHHGGVINETARRVTEAGLTNSSARILPPGSVLLCRTAASIGHVCRLGRPMATSQDFAAWVCGPAMNPAYLTYLLVGETTFLKRLGRGSAHPTIYLPEIRALSITLAPLDEQEEIVSRLDKIFAKITAIESEVDAATKSLPFLTRQIHEYAFQGKFAFGEAGGEDINVSLSRHRVEMELKAPKRPSRKFISEVEIRSVAEQLADRYDIWPESGYAFEDIRDMIPASYEDIRAAVFGALRDSTLKQRFDARRRLMVFVRGTI